MIQFTVTVNSAHCQEVSCSSGPGSLPGGLLFLWPRAGKSLPKLLPLPSIGRSALASRAAPVCMAPAAHEDGSAGAAVDDHVDGEPDIQCALA
jgi:hypothetical protein